MAKTKITNNVGTTLNTEGIVKAIAEKSKATDSPLSQRQVQTALNLMKSVIEESMATGQKIQLTGFLSIVPSYRAPRNGHNVITKQPMDIPGCVVASIKAGKSLKDAMKSLDESLVEAIKNQDK